MESPKPDKLNIVKDVRNLFRLNEIKNEKNDAGIKVIRSLFRLEKKYEAIKDRIEVLGIYLRNSINNNN